MTTVLAVAVSILPVFLFLGALVLIDSYKLVALRAVLLSVAAGMVAGLASYGVNVWLRPALELDWDQYSRYVAPVVEESLKAGFVVYLLRMSKVGFVVDAAIHGFGIGTGFAFLENLYYLQVHPDATLWTWVVRGFGTAIMHGGATSIVAMVSKTLHNRPDAFRLHLLLPGLAVAVVLHSLYNHFLLQPILATALIVLVFPALCVAVFQQSERQTQAWVGAGFDTDQELLRVIRSGQVSLTPVGTYLKTLRNTFSAEVIVDMMCLLRLRAELAIRAKGVLMMREAGFEAAPDPTVKNKLEELRYLETNIGRTGLRALHPFLHTSTRDLWQLSVIDG
ncbi:MAG TPA: PrsW family glutamic-type intramembrane protease [Gemmatimonadales bacterium]|nr:PrsW family glutamic-type intramembrane protease [Gemmatimonadales bacterium]